MVTIFCSYLISFISSWKFPCVFSLLQRLMDPRICWFLYKILWFLTSFYLVSIARFVLCAFTKNFWSWRRKLLALPQNPPIFFLLWHNMEIQNWSAFVCSVKRFVCISLNNKREKSPRRIWNNPERDIVFVYFTNIMSRYIVIWPWYSQQRRVFEKEGQKERSCVFWSWCDIDNFQRVFLSPFHQM